MVKCDRTKVKSTLFSPSRPRSTYDRRGIEGVERADGVEVDEETGHVWQEDDRTKGQAIKTVHMIQGIPRKKENILYFIGSPTSTNENETS